MFGPPTKPDTTEQYRAEALGGRAADAVAASLAASGGSGQVHEQWERLHIEAHGQEWCRCGGHGYWTCVFMQQKWECSRLGRGRGMAE